MAVNNWILANLIWITLAIAILVLIYFVFAIIQTIRKKRRLVSQLNVLLLILGLMFLIFLTYHANEIEGKDWGQIILMLGLVIVTALYASSTEKQASASVKMAEAMARPYLLLKLTSEYLQWDDIKGGQSAAREFAVTVFNAGGGPARNLSASLWKSNDIFPADTKGYLAPNQEWVANICKLSTDGVALGSDIPLPILKNKVKGNRPIVTVEYEDVHHTKWASYLYLEEVDDTNYVRDGEQNIVEL